MKTLGQSHDCNSLAVEVGEIFSVCLPEIPVTGYRWVVNASPETAFEIISDNFELAGEASTGGGGNRLFRLVARTKGRASLELRLIREWEANAASARELHYDISVE